MMSSVLLVVLVGGCTRQVCVNPSGSVNQLHAGLLKQLITSARKVVCNTRGCFTKTKIDFKLDLTQPFMPLVALTIGLSIMIFRLYFFLQ